MERNIYKIGKELFITSDEEIKEGDWMYYKHFGEDIVCKYDTMNGQNTNVNEHKPYYQKIILTTDQVLIADGVQAINDEFLEWFVKNPSCEFVNLENHVLEVGYNLYKIIIPKEPQQETLEEAALRIFQICLYENQNGQTEDLNENDRLRFIEGAKWQSERMYSEEEVLDILRKSHSIEQTSKMDSYITKWFEQFKKKQ
jgi:hypothetical protein